MTKIFLSESDWYVETDEDGYPLGTYFEGTLGCIIQARNSKSPNRPPMALKLPRLLADSDKENGYIISLCRSEFDILKRVKPASGIFSPDVGIAEPVAKITKVEVESGKGVTALNGYILVSYELNRRPKFCVVVPGDAPSGRVDTVPSKCAIVLGAIKSWSSMLEIASAAEKSGIGFQVSRNDTVEGGIGDVAQLLRAGVSSQRWYGGLPSMLMSWAAGNLQEAIETGQLLDWKPVEHLKLTRNIVDGLLSLHADNILHGDIRPANILHSVRTKQESLEPEQFRIADYGSFSAGFSAVGFANQSGETSVGPSVGAIRSSPFYAPERRHGTELEVADVAIVTSRVEADGSLKYVVRVGWRSKIFDESGVVLRSIDVDGLSESTSLISGDRVRLRNFLFTVQSAKQGQFGMVLICDGRYSTLVNDKVVLVQDSQLPENFEIALNGITEYYQWSAATDLYGIGALSLYSVFVNAWRKHGATLQPEAFGKRADDVFREMMETLENPQYGAFIWSEIDIITERVAGLGSDGTNGSCRSHIVEYDGTKEPIGDVAVKVTNSILASTPWVRVVLAYFDDNTIKFLLFMQFILGCVHRGSSIKPNASSSRGPFCRTRSEGASEGGARRARDRIDEVIRLVSQQHLDSFNEADGKKLFVVYKPQSDYSMRLEIAKYQRKIDAVRKVADGNIAGLVRAQSILLAVDADSK